MMSRMKMIGLFVSLLSFYGVWAQEAPMKSETVSGLRKVKDLVIYENAWFHSAFPSIIKRSDGTYFLAFRRAPNRKVFNESVTYHVDPNSYLVGVASRDGETWTPEPELIHAHPFGGAQDPCLIQLSDGSILCASYTWATLREEGLEKLKQPAFALPVPRGPVFLGGFMLRSKDGGHRWGTLPPPPNISTEYFWDAFGEPMPSYNRGAMFEGKNGQVYWAVASVDSDPPLKTSVHLLVSDDRGESWQYGSLIARDETVSFNETSIYETPQGDLVAFMRTSEMDDHACIARSQDGGKTFRWESMGFQGHPLHALRLPDNRVLVTYGYRHAPMGIRARVLNAECTDYASAPELILREDGGETDLGYPWSVMLDEKRVLVSYYFNIGDGTRHIAGTILEIVE